MSKNPLVIYHSADLDGKCSAAVTLTYLNEPADLYPINYGQDFDWEMVKDRPVVVMVDFCLQPFSDMIKLHDLVGQNSLIWIDHHKTAIDEYDKYMVNQKAHWHGLREIGRAGCELAWERFFPALHVPLAVKYLGQYDVWCHEDKNTLAFQYGMRTVGDCLPDSPIWDLLFEGDEALIDEFIATGGIVLKYERQQNEIYAKSRSFPTSINGLRAIACNRGLCNSTFFDSVWDPEKHDLMLAFCLTPKGHWKVQLYTGKPDVDVSVIAKNHGGGGHRGAAGFECDELPFELQF